MVVSFRGPFGSLNHGPYRTDPTGHRFEAVAMDPLGAPGIKGSDFVALLGTDTWPAFCTISECYKRK